jgi:hypothetical protein
MNDTSLNLQRKILCFAAIVEVGTGLILMIDPAIVVKLLIGSEVSGRRRCSVDVSVLRCSRWGWRAVR